MLEFALPFSLHLNTHVIQKVVCRHNYNNNVKSKNNYIGRKDEQYSYLSLSLTTLTMFRKREI